MSNAPGIYMCAADGCGELVERDRDGVIRDFPALLGQRGGLHTHGERLRLVKGGTPAAS